MGQILIVDGSLLDRKRMRAILEAAGHQVLESTAPTEAMARLQNLVPGSIKLILTELEFAEESGMEFIRWIRAREELSHVPLLAVTAQQPKEMLVQLVLAGVASVVTKPFGGDMLLRRVTETLSARAVLRQGEDDYLTWPLEGYLRRELKRAERAGAPFSVVLCRMVDSMRGKALPHFISGVVALLRESDILARWGEEQVVILLPDTDATGAEVVVSKVHELGQSLENQSGGRMLLPVPVVAGSATFPSEAADAVTLLSMALSRLT